MFQKIVPSRGPFETAVRPFTVEFRINPSPVLGFVPIKVASQSKSFRAVATTVWFRVGFTMPTEKEPVSLADKFKVSRSNTYLYCPRRAKDLAHDSHLINPLILLSICKLDMMFVGLKLYQWGCSNSMEALMQGYSYVAPLCKRT
jgi:hypothetical protein